MKAKRNLMRLASLFVTLVALLAISGCGGSSAGGGGGEGGKDLLQEVKDRGVLRVSTDPAYPPQSFQTQSGDFKGFEFSGGASSSPLRDPPRSVRL